jgi:hypothetical protein
VNETRPLTLYATVQEAPPDHRGGYTLGRDELIVEDVDYDQALAAARRRVPEGRGLSRSGSSAIESRRADRSRTFCALR